MQNSANGALSTPQLRLAYAALVRSAGAGTSTSDSIDALALSQYCIDALLAAITSSTKVDKERTHRLHQTLISTLPSLPLALLPEVLDSIKNIILGLEDAGERKELTEDLFAEILERVGDREKEFVMHWWFNEKGRLLAGNVQESEVGKKDEVSSKDTAIASRL